MKKYKVFVNGKRQGAIKTDNAAAFIEKNYPGVKSHVDEVGSEIYLTVGIMDAMKIAES